MGLFNRVIYEQVKNNEDFEYQEAIEHYKQLREKLIDQIQELRYSKQLENISNAEIEKMLTTAGQKVEENTTKQLRDVSKRYLEDLVKWVDNQFSKNNDFGKIIKEMGQELAEKKKKVSQYSFNKIVKQKQQEILAIINQETDEKSILYSIVKNKQLITDPNYQSVASYLTSYLMRVIRWRAETGKIYISDKDISRLAGYEKEVVELELFKNLFEQLGLGDYSPQLIAKENTITDILLPFEKINGVVADASEQIELTSFGIQSKLKAINFSESSFFKVSHQSALSKAFNQIKSEERGWNKYQWTAGVAFLAQKANILQSLGENNVLFLSGQEAYFMDSFIKQFRANSKYLAFEFDLKTHKATSQIGIQGMKKK